LKNDSVKTRIAPTPSGFLHLGNAFNFVLTALIVDLMGGHLHLRIDDFDKSRTKLSFVEDIFVQLEWLGIEYNSGPSGPGELFSQYSQQLRKDSYFEALEILRKNDFIFACECSRSEIRELSSNGIYPGICLHKNIDLNKSKCAWRINVPDKTYIKFKTFFDNYEKIDVSKAIGDFVVKRKDGLPAYQITSLIDDIEMGINLIVRGTDLLPSTSAQIFLAECLKEDTFHAINYIHHKLIIDNSGQKLSKSCGSFSLKGLKKQLNSPSWIFQQIAQTLKLPYKEISTLGNLKEAFRKAMKQKINLNNLLR